MNKEAHLFILSAAGAELERARQHLDIAMEDVRREIIAASEFDIPITEISIRTNVSRQTIYNIIHESRN